MSNDNITTAEKINILSSRKKIGMSKIAELTGQTRQNLYTKMRRNEFKESHIRSIGEALGCDVRITFIDKETGEEL